MNVAMILAGGSGMRMGANVPKQFVEIQGKPIIIHTLEKLEAHPYIDAIEIVCIPNYIGYVKDLVKQAGIRKVRLVTAGGSSFLESVKNGVHALSSICADDDIVMIHMSVAPFIEADIITDAIEVCQKHGNSVSMNPCLLCIGEYTTPEYSAKSVLRETLAGLNTPQTFYYADLADAFAWAEGEGILDSLEPHLTSLMYERGVKLYFSKGSQYNFKITTKEDLDLFEGYLIAKKLKKDDWRADK